jgi:putative flippase GtrA
MAGRFGRFVLVNASGTLLETVVLWALSRAWPSFGGSYLAAPVLAFECALLSNYTLSYVWVWRGQVAGTAADWASRLAPYHAGCAGVFLGRLGLVAAAGALLGVDVVLANFGALLLSGLASFGVQQRLVFSPVSRPRAAVAGWPRGRSARTATAHAPPFLLRP